MSRVSVIGGSIAGLIAGRELALNSIDVTVYEEHREIGVPEKCDGLVSCSGMAELGVVVPSSILQNKLEKAVFISPSGSEAEIDARKQNVVVIDRARFDKYLAERAAKSGVKIEVGRRVSQSSQTKDSVSIKVDSDTIQSDLLLDCSGYESYIRNGGKTLLGGQYLVYGRWFQKNRVEVYVDPKSAPGFFAWVIPISSDVAKIGVAGEGINTFEFLDAFCKNKGAVPIRKMAAPITCYGLTKSFIEGRIAKAGDAAGQAKPTTGGGIYTGGYGGLLLGRAASRAIREKDVSLLRVYEDEWKQKFGIEFRLQLLARNLFAKLSREQVDKLIEMVGSSDLPRKIAEEGDFDRHSVAILKAFGISNLASTFGMFFTNELKSLLG